MIPHIGISPFIPLMWICLLGAVASLPVLILLLQRQRGAFLRLLALSLLLLTLLNPHLTSQTHETLPNTLAIVVDHSASARLNGRVSDTSRVRAALIEKLKPLKNMELRWIEAPTPQDAHPPQEGGTHLFQALAQGTADLPPEHMAGAIFITDGQVHDRPSTALPYPVHALITGSPFESDRRLIIEHAPRFGIKGQTIRLTLRVEDIGAVMDAPIPLTVKRDGDIVTRLEVSSNQSIHVEVPIPHAGQHLMDISVDPLPGELTALNNTAVSSVKGARDSLKVLLISGAPHEGLRTWRSLLKADTNVNLVHFTILRQPDRMDTTPLNELSLIAFPTRELFQEKISQFDLIIFDRFERRGILPPAYFDNIADYVRKGGALLIAAGPEDAGNDSLFQTSIAPLLPVDPSGQMDMAGFTPHITPLGLRHPVTRDLLENSSQKPLWGRWMRRIDAQQRAGISLMSAHGSETKAPLLVLDRQEKGRVGIVLSDHIWLWARKFEGGGPHTDLLRRLAHWLMKEPDLEEESLSLRVQNDQLLITRQTMRDTLAPLTLERPNGEKQAVSLAQGKAGLFSAQVQATDMGLYRVFDADKQALAYYGAVDEHEFKDARSTLDVLSPLLHPSGGKVLRALHKEDVHLPAIRQVAAQAALSGDDWIGVRHSTRQHTISMSHHALFSGFLALLLLGICLAVLWWRENRT